MSDVGLHLCMCFFFSSRRRHTRFDCDWSSDCALPIFDTLEKLLGDDLVSVYVRPIERRDQSLVYAKRLHFFLSGSVKTPDRKSTRLNSSHSQISYAVFCLKKKIMYNHIATQIRDASAR